MINQNNAQMRKVVFILVCVFCFQPGVATTCRLTLEETILRARSHSVEAAVALNELRAAYWEYRTYRANLLPEINFNTVLPSYNKTYSAYQQVDGSYTFVRNNNLNMTGNVSIEQNIWLTGGKISLSTSLDYMQQLNGDKTKRFMSVPIALTLTQPIFGVNDVKWSRKIDPLRYQEAKASFISETENVAIVAINFFFNLLLARENVNISKQNINNAERLYEVAKAKREMGKISENDLLQLKLNLLNAQADLTNNESTMKSAMFKLCSFIDLNVVDEVIPVVPDSIPNVELQYQEILDKALANNPFALNMSRRRLEADYEVAKAKGDMREISLYAQIGFTGTDQTFAGAYNPLKDNQVVEVGVKIPILDWGKRKGKVKVAQSNKDVIENKLRKESMDFNQNLFILTEQFNNQRQQLKIAQEADEIAQRRYNTNVETFMLGKLSTLDLNDAQSSKDQARQKCINELFYYWYYYYQLRSITLWDFERNCSIDADFDKIIDI